MKLDHIEHADALTYLRSLQDESVNLIVTSPPYLGLRDYGTATWEGGDANCDHVVQKVGMSEKNTLGPNGHLPPTNAANVGRVLQARDICPKCGAKRIDQQIGAEPTPAEFVAALVAVFAEAKRVLRKDGSAFVNLGDSYGPNKQIQFIPHRFAIAMQEAGWICRQDIVWSKANPMPESVRDRCTRSHEYIFHFTKQPRYWYDQQAVMEPNALNPNWNYGSEKYRTKPEGREDQFTQYKKGEKGWHGFGPAGPNGTGRNRRSVWTVNTAGYKEAHFATFPEKLIEPMILAGCPEWCCDRCGAPYEAQVERESNWAERRAAGATGGSLTNGHNGTHGRGMSHDLGTGAITHNGYAPSCTCNAGKRAGVVLDPFMGAGTTALVAKRLNRRYLGCDLNAEYVRLARERIDGPLFAAPVEKAVIVPPAIPSGPEMIPMFEEAQS